MEKSAKVVRREGGILSASVWKSLVTEAREATHVDHVSFWKLSPSRGTANLLAASMVELYSESPQELWLGPENSLVATFTRGGQYQGSVCEALSKAKGFFYALGVSREVGLGRCYILNFYQRSSPLSLTQLQQADDFGNLARALTHNYRAKRMRLHRETLPYWRSEERMRREIADILHGPVQTRLLLLEKQLADIRQFYEIKWGEPLPELADVEAQLENLRENDVRQLSHRLHPDLIAVGLAAALRSLQQSYRSSLKIGLAMSPAFLKIDAPIHNRIPEPIRLAIYRIIEEAVSNAVQHGAAHQLWVSLDYDPNTALTAKVRDNGTGFSVSAGGDPEGLGIRLMKARARQWGGRLMVMSEPPDGTTVHLIIPSKMVDDASNVSPYEYH